MTVQLAAAFPTGTLVRLLASFTRAPTQEEIDDGTATNADDWQPMDPDEVTAKVGKVIAGVMDDETITEHAYLNSPTDIVRTAVGEYYLEITAGSANVGKRELNHWRYRFEGVGNGQSANEYYFVVEGSSFP